MRGCTGLGRERGPGDVARGWRPRGGEKSGRKGDHRNHHASKMRGRIWAGNGEFLNIGSLGTQFVYSASGLTTYRWQLAAASALPLILRSRIDSLPGLFGVDRDARRHFEVFSALAQRDDIRFVPKAVHHDKALWISLGSPSACFPLAAYSVCVCVCV